MVNFQRLILFITLCLTSLFAFADYAAYDGWSNYDGRNAKPTSELSCRFVFESYTGSYTYSRAVIQSSGTTAFCYGIRTNDGVSEDKVAETYKVKYCASGLPGGANGDVCSGTPPTPTCVPPQVLDTVTNTCAIPAPKCTTGAGPSGFLATGSCIDSCTHVWSGQTTKIGADSYGLYLGQTGASCSTSPSVLRNHADVDAAFAKVDATNASTARATAAAATAATVSKAAVATQAAKDLAAKTATDASLATSQLASAIQSLKDAIAASGANSSQAAAAQSQVDAATAGAAQTAGAAASAAKSETPKDPQDFCDLHPDSIICKDSNVSAGTCYGAESVGFSCSGDAVQCSIAAEQQKRNCQFYAGDENLTSKYNDAQAESASGTTKGATIVNLPTSLDETSVYAAKCNTDLTLQFNGQTTVLPFSAWCNVLTSLGYLFLACAYMSGAAIIGSST